MNAVAELRGMSEEVLARVGEAELAYVRPLQLDEHVNYAIFSADGDFLAMAHSRDSAFGLIRCQGLEPVDAH